MTDSIYPSELDNDATLPRVDANISEIGPDAINALRSAAFAIETALGLNPQGEATDLTTRLDVSLNLDGSIKAAALAAVGLVTLPITNTMVSSSAGVEESKLDLDYGTVQLKTWIDENRIRINSTTNHLAYHTATPSTWGRHTLEDIDGIGETLGKTLDEILDELDAEITNHINDTVDAHDGTAISFDDSNVPFFAANVQLAIEATEERTQRATLIHQNTQHSNGVLKTQEAYYNNTNHSFTLVPSTSIGAVTVGDNSITFSSSPISFDEVSRGDRIDITVNSNTYERYVNTTTSPDTISFFGVIPEDAVIGTAIVYKSSVETLAPSAVNFGIRQLNISESGGSVIQLVHHSAPYVLSVNMDVRGLQSSSTRNIKIGWGSGSTSTLNLYTLMGIFNTNPSTWTAENLAIVLNEEFRGSNNYPLIAFTYKGELGLAVDEPDGYVEIMPPSSNSAWSILGFIEDEIGYQLDRKLFIDGYEYTDIRKMVNATATVGAGNPNLLDNISKNVKAAGVKAPGIVRVKNAVSSDIGTYLFTQVNSEDSITISEHTFTPTATGTTIDIEIYSDSFAVSSAPTNKTFYELFLDGYSAETEGAEFRGVKRLEYYKTSGSSQDMSTYFDITDVSRTFPEGERRIIYTISGSTITMALGTRGAVLTLDQSGPAVTLPAAAATITGYKFTLFDYNGTDFIELEVVTNYSILTTGNALDIDILPRPNEKKYLQISKTLHNKTLFKHLDDRRLFGNVGRKDVRDDFTRDYTSYPRSLLRGNGIIHGFSTSNTSTAITINGGEVIVNGIVYNVTKKTYNVPEDNVATIYNLFIDTNGILQFLQDDQYIEGVISTPSVSEIIASEDKTIIAQVNVNSSNNITSVVDLRRYINNLDNKIELIVDDDLTHGSFSTLTAAVNYITLQGSSASSPVVIKIRGAIYHDASDTLAIPTGITIEGESSGFGSPTFGTNLILIGTGTTVFSLGNGCTFRNLRLQMDSSATITSLFGDGSDHIADLTIENCQFTGLLSSGAIYAINADNLVNFYMNRSQFSVSSANGNATSINVTGNITTCVIKNSNIDFASVANTQVVLSVSGNTSGLFIENFESIVLSSAGNNRFCSFTGTSDEIHFSKCNIIFPSTSGSSKTMYFGANASNFIFRDSELYFGNGESLFIDTSNDLTELVIENCQFTFNSSNNDSTFINSGEIIDGLISNVKLSFASTSGTNMGFNIAGTNRCTIFNTYATYGANGTGRFIYSTSNLDNLLLNSCELTFGSTSDNNTLLYVNGNLNNCNIDKCVVDFPSTTGTSVGVQCTDATNFVINDTNLVGTDAKSGDYGFYAVNGTNCKLLNCKISQVDKAVSITTLFTKCVIEDCYILNTLSEAIDITDGSDIFIRDNVIQTASVDATADALINANSIDNLNISNNHLQYLDTGTDTPVVPMIEIDQCNNYLVHNNILLNKDHLTQGMLGGINIDCALDSYGIVSNNIIKFFKYNSTGYGINVDSSNITCSDNKIITCRIGINLIDTNNSIFTGNHIDCSTGDDGLNIKGLYIGGDSDRVVISDNTVLSDETTLDASAKLVDYSSGTTSHYLFANNIFKVSNSSGSAAVPIKIESEYLIFSNNTIEGGDFTGTEPLWIKGGGTGKEAEISNNYFNITFGSSSPLTTNTNDIDHMNKGQLYNVVIPISKAAFTTTGGWVYDINNSDPSRLRLYNASTSDGEAGIEFTSSDIPVGSELSSVVVYVSAGALELTASLRSIAWNSTTGAQLVAPTAPSGDTITLTPSSVYMEKNKSYMIYAITDSGAVTDVYIYSVYVTYKL